MLGQIRLFRAPAVRIVAHNDPEYKDIKFAMEKMSVIDHELVSKVRESLKRPFLMIVEYIPGFNLGMIQGVRAEMLFHPDVTKGYVPDSVPYPPPSIEGCRVDANSDFKESPLITLGKIIGADIVMNNSDRFPSIW